MLNSMHLVIPLDRESEEPIYRQLIRHIKAQVESGNLPAGVRLPASRDLARQLNISRISVVNAYAELRAEGYLSAHAGRGTFVAGEHTAPVSTPLPISAPTTTHNVMNEPTFGDKPLREMMRLARRPGVINLGLGSPPSEFFPVHHVKEAINIVLERDGARALAYEATEGYAPLRATVRDYVSGLGIRCSADHVLITGGTQQAIDLVVQALVGEGELLVAETPTYLGLIDIARTRRVQMMTIPMDEDGMRLDMLENLILDVRPRLIFSTPSFHNPTGISMPMHRRRQLLNLANMYNVPILEDGVYHEFRFEGDAHPPLKALDDTGIVIHASGFTKNLLPGLRIGYIIIDGPQYERVLRVKQAADISTPTLNQRAIHTLVERGILAQHLERNNKELRRRRDIAVKAAKTHLPPGSRWMIPSGGLYLWVELPRTGPNSAELYVNAVQTGVAYAMGAIFHTNGGGSHHMRLNFAAHKPFEIEEAFRRLGRAWRELACDYTEMEKQLIL